jgi:hypothetical protein
MYPLTRAALRCLLVPLVAFAPGVVPPPARAIIAPRLDIAELTLAADVIVVGTATESRSVWIEGNLYTLVTLDVQETLKGLCETSITTVLPGGIDANRPIPVATVWPGQPRIDIREQVLVFLQRLPEPPETYGIVGFSQGKFTLEDDGEGAPTLVQDLRDLHLVEAQSMSPGSLRRFSLAALREQIRQTLAAEEGR